MDPYTLSPQERQRYEGLFPSYAKTEEDGVSQFVYGSEAVPLFMKSGVDPNSLREIWNMVDRNPVDNRLDRLEFALAMHLIVCVSKKNLPMPPGGTLPNSLHALKAANSVGGGVAQNAPASGGAVAPPQQPTQMQMPPPQAETTMAAPAPNMGMGISGLPPLVGPDSSAMGGMNISSAFEGMSTMDSVAEYSLAPEAPAAPALPSYVSTVPTPAMVPEPPTPQPQPTYVHQPQSPKRSVVQTPPVPASVASTAVTYEVSDSHLEELKKLKSMLQNLQAENISLKAQLGNMTEEEKQVQQELGQAVTEITTLASDLGFQRQEVLDAKNRLLEAKAELKAQRDTKGVLTELISEAKETSEAIESATESLRATTEDQSSIPPVQGGEELFDMGYSNPIGGPPPVAENPSMSQSQQGLEGFNNEHGPSDNMMGIAGGVASLPLPTPQPAGDIVFQGSAPQEQQHLSIPIPSGQGDQQQQQQQQQQQSTMYSNYTAPAPPQAGGYPAQPSMPPQRHSPVPQHQPAVPGQNGNPSGFEDDFLMGGSAQAIPLESSRDNDNFSQAARSMASTGDYGYDDQAFEIVENMKKKAKKADGIARDAETAFRTATAEADELRTDADRADANSRTLAVAAEEKKKKGRFGGSKKKKMKEEAEQAAKDAALIKSHFMAVQSRALEAQKLAAKTRSKADRLRDEAEAAELDMAAAASKNQKQPDPVSAAPPADNGYNNGSPALDYGGMGAAPQQSLPQGQAPQYGMSNGGPPWNGGGYGDTYGQLPQQQQQQQNAYGAPPQMSLPDPSMYAGSGVMGNGSGDYGGYDMPSPAHFAPPPSAPAAPATGGDPYASPF